MGTGARRQLLPVGNDFLVSGEEVESLEQVGWDLQLVDVGEGVGATHPALDGSVDKPQVPKVGEGAADGPLRQPGDGR
ncbi:hypothetical protein ASG41_13095 [Modestobacter sp. Leaf380]|nr:hypothetical protein ASG41_13095 [Modestobacter sp. Leaf380]